MALVTASVVQICKSVAQYLNVQLNAGGGSTVGVSIGCPADAVPGESDPHGVNLFFFRFEPSGFGADVLPGETGFIRMHCLVTPFAVQEGSVSAGENDLRLVGEVLRIFHEKPVFSINVDGEEFHTQALFHNLELDQINQLWSTQGDTVYRPSLLYEISLAPVVPKIKAEESRLVASLGLDVSADMEGNLAPPAERFPRVPVSTPDTSREDWVPAICFVIAGHCEQSVSFEAGGAPLAAFTPPKVWVAGKIGETVDLRWEVWDSTASPATWVSQGATTPATIAQATLDPRQATEATLTASALPFSDRSGQMTLFAERSYTRSSDQATIKVRSNPLLVNLYGGTP